MPTIYLETLIDAPIETCFDLARDIDAHQLSTSKTKEKAVSGKVSGLCEKGDIITWQATHFGVRQYLTVQITKMDKPKCFEDEMQKGAFAFMKHTHSFRQESSKTIMIDEFKFSAPLGFLGKIAEKLFLTAYMTNFLRIRNAALKSMAESKSNSSIGS
jgi:ligand-binding SRPBCC domain-containing protein